MRTKYSKDASRAKTPEQKGLYLAGIPYRYWGSDTKNVNFQKLSYRNDAKDGKSKVEVLADVEQQKVWFNSLKKDKTLWRQPSVLVLGSSPTDYEAMAMMTVLVRRLLAWEKQVQVQNMADSDGHTFFQNPAAYFAYNLTEEIEEYSRRARVRDWVVKHADTFRVLAVAGNPLNFALDTLHVRPDAACFVDGSKSLTLSLG